MEIPFNIYWKNLHDGNNLIKIIIHNVVQNILDDLKRKTSFCWYFYINFIEINILFCDNFVKRDNAFNTTSHACCPVMIQHPLDNEPMEIILSSLPHITYLLSTLKEHILSAIFVDRR